MKILNKEQILGTKLKTTNLYIPEWGGRVVIQEPTALERSEFELMATNSDKSKEALKIIRGYCAAKCIVDNNGVRLFNDDDIKLLNNLSANALDKVIDAYKKMSLMDDDSLETSAKN